MKTVAGFRKTRHRRLERMDFAVWRAKTVLTFDDGWTDEVGPAAWQSLPRPLRVDVAPADAAPSLRSRAAARGHPAASAISSSEAQPRQTCRPSTTTWRS